MKYFRRLNFLALIIPFYFLTRLINFLVIPIFTDEAIYSYWAQVALHDPMNRFISLEDGKQPLFIWIAAIFQEFIANPLVATRFVSVVAGLGSLIGIYFLAKELFGKKVAIFSSFLYVVLPFTLLYDRMALYDSLLTMFCIWAVFLSVKMAKTPRLDYALLNGIVLGLGFITKSSADFFLYLLPLTLIIFDFKQKQVVKHLAKWVSLSALSAVMAEIIYNALRVSPLFYMINRKNLTFIRSFSDVIKNPFEHFLGNIQSMVTWLFQYTGPLILIPLAVMVYALIKRDKKVILLSAYIAAPFFAEALFNQVLYPRFLLFYFPFLIILISFGATLFLKWGEKYKKIVWAILLVLLIYPLLSSIFLLTNPPQASIAGSDQSQYIDEWPAGYGVSNVLDVLKGSLKSGQKVYVGTEGTFGLLPYALQIYFYANQNIQVVGFWPVRDIPQQVLDAAKSKKTYFVFNETQDLSDNSINPHLKLIGKYRKGNGNSFMHLYEVTP